MSRPDVWQRRISQLRSDRAAILFWRWPRSVAFYRDGACCVSAKEQTTIGTLEKCHNAGSRFGSITQTVGSNMFGHDIHIEVFTGSDCQGDKVEVNLSNKDPRCDATGANERFASFRIHGPPPKPTCDWRSPTNSDANVVTIDLYNDARCCDYSSHNRIGQTVCQDTPDGVIGLGIAAGNNWLKNGFLYMYADKSCQENFAYLPLTSGTNSMCLVSDGLTKSYLFAVPSGQYASSATDSPTAPGTSQPHRLS